VNHHGQQQVPDVDADDYETVELGALVVGAGAAGARAAIELAERGVDTDDFLVIGKRSHGDAHTTWARGGVNGALGTHDPEDDWTVHAADTLNEGHHLNDPAKVEAVTHEMPARLRELDEWGMPFSRTEEGGIDQRYFGAQSFRRTAFAGDHTGESMLNTLTDRARELGVRYRENVMITRVVTDDDGRALGAAGYDMDDGHLFVFVFDAAVVILAAGGYVGIYDRHTSRDDENTGDGPALAYEAGATLIDMELVQFHPTGMAVDEDDSEWAPWAGRLVTEAVRGEGGAFVQRRRRALHGAVLARSDGVGRARRYHGGHRQRDRSGSRHRDRRRRPRYQPQVGRVHSGAPPADVRTVRRPRGRHGRGTG
jgi:succinate dehydrogenase / fumarate reductase flavoprotein subunit